MTDEESVRATLRRLAGVGDDDQSTRRSASLHPAHRQTIDRASAALDDIEAAATFVEDGGLAALGQAVEAAEGSVSASAERGREVIDEYRRLQAALAGEQFRSGRGTSLGDGDEAGTR